MTTPLNPSAVLLDCYHAAVAAADPLKIVPTHLAAILDHPPKTGRTVVVGAGKAAASMAKAVEDAWRARYPIAEVAPLEGLVITRYAHGYTGEQALTRIRVIEAGHPVPDESGERAAREIMALVKALTPDDLLIVLVSGGGSSLLALPVEGISIADLKATTKELLRCGAPIEEMNVVRKHISAIQGGRMAQMCLAPILALTISDVTGDDPTHIASGPCAPDPSTFAEALGILTRYGCTIPASVKTHLTRGIKGDIDETPKAGSPVFTNVENRVIATAHQSLEAAATACRAHGIHPILLGDTVTGEAREVAKAHAALVREIVAYRADWPAPDRPIALISGGECTVTVKEPTGKGGRCSEYALSLAIALNGMPNVCALAADTDGIDGSETNAGAAFGPDTLENGSRFGLSAIDYLARNDAFSYFKAVNSLITTGPTRTNVNDFRVILMT